MSSNAVTTSQSGESTHDAERLPLNAEISAIPLDSSAANPLTADTHATDARSALKLLRFYFYFLLLFLILYTLRPFSNKITFAKKTNLITIIFKTKKKTTADLPGSRVCIGFKMIK